MIKIKFIPAALIVMLYLTFSGALLSEDNENANQKINVVDSVEYGFKISYPTGIYNVYKFTEITNVQRKYSDSSVKEYERELTYFINHFYSDLPQNGFNKVQVTIDSMYYKFTEGDAVFEFDSRLEDIPNINFQDLTVAAVSLGKSFFMTYSPYGDLAKLEGEDLDWLRNYVLVNGKDALDTLKKFFWLRGVSESHLAFISDLQKKVIPSGRVRGDSVWTTEIFLETDGIDVFDELKSELVSYNAGIYTISGKSDNLRLNAVQAQLYPINQLVDLDTCRGTVKYEVQIAPRGVIKEVNSEIDAEVVARIKKEQFYQRSKTKLKWELIGQYKF